MKGDAKKNSTHGGPDIGTAAVLRRKDLHIRLKMGL
jgi:hypothetical protein